MSKLYISLIFQNVFTSNIVKCCLKQVFLQNLCNTEQNYFPSKSSVLRQVSILELLDSFKYKPLPSNNVKFINLS